MLINRFTFYLIGVLKDVHEEKKLTFGEYVVHSVKQLKQIKNTDLLGIGICLHVLGVHRQLCMGYFVVIVGDNRASFTAKINSRERSLPC